MRDGANARAAKLAENDPLRKQLQQLAADCDALRSKIVATKEGGMITGEERIREHLGQLYGAVTGYDGKPTDYQLARTESLGHELQDVIDDFQKLTQKELPGINASLKKKKLEAITVPAEGDWQKKTRLPRPLPALECGRPRVKCGTGIRTGYRPRMVCSPRALILVRLGNQLGHLGLLAHRLDAQDLIGIEVHAVGLVQLLAALDQHVGGLLGL